MGVPRAWAIKRDHGTPLGKRGTHGDGLVVARVGVLVVVGGGVRGHHRRHHRRLPRRQGDAAAGHHRPTRAYPGHPGQPQSAWCVGLGRGGPWGACVCYRMVAPLTVSGYQRGEGFPSPFTPFACYFRADYIAEM